MSHAQTTWSSHKLRQYSNQPHEVNIALDKLLCMGKEGLLSEQFHEKKRG